MHLGCPNETNNNIVTNHRRKKRQLDLTTKLWKTPIAYRFAPEEELEIWGI